MVITTTAALHDDVTAITTTAGAPTALTTTTMSSQLVATTMTEFSFYVPGLYGMDCFARGFNWVFSNQLDLSPYNDAMNCACFGLCIPSLEPHLDAYEYYQDYVDENAAAQLEEKLKYHAPFMAVTILLVILGIAGKNPLIR